LVFYPLVERVFLLVPLWLKENISLLKSKK